MDRIFRFRHLAIPVALAIVGLLPAKARAAAPTITIGPTSPAGGSVVCAGTANTLTATISDADAADTVTVTSPDAPASVTFNPPLGTATTAPVAETVTITPPAGSSAPISFTLTATDSMSNVTSTVVNLAVSQAPVITLSQAGTPVTQPVGGFIAVVGRPFILDVATSDPDVADTVTLGVKSSTNGGAATAGTPPGGVQDPNLIGSDTSGPSGSDALGTATGGATFSSRLTFTPSAAEAGSTFVLSYLARDNRGCLTTLPVTVLVQNPAPTTITVTSVPDITTTLITPDQQVCFTTTVVDQDGNPVPGATVTFNLSGGPFNNVTVNGGPVLTTGPASTATVTGTTDALGHAVICVTPLFAGPLNLSVSSGGVTFNVPSATVVVISTPGAAVSGQGVIDFAPGTSPPIPGRFSLDLRSKTNGTFAGVLDLVQTGTRGGIFRARSTTIDGVVINTISSQAGRHASIFGTLVATGLGAVPFRADLIDVATPGSPGDSIVITLNVAGVPPIVIGGNLLFYQGDKGFRGYDIVIKPGIPTGGGGGIGGIGGSGGGGNGGGGGKGKPVKKK